MLLTAHLFSATKVYYVLPDNFTYRSCPSQPCATLSQHLQEISELSFVSDVEFHFLPGEHQVTTSIMIQHVNKFLLSGNTEHLPSLICNLGVFINIAFSRNVTITGISVINCGNTSNPLTSVVIYNCVYCNIIDVNFYPPSEHYSLAGINLVGQCQLYT